MATTTRTPGRDGVARLASAPTSPARRAVTAAPPVRRSTPRCRASSRQAAPNDEITVDRAPARPGIARRRRARYTPAAPACRRERVARQRRRQPAVAASRCSPPGSARARWAATSQLWVVNGIVVTATADVDRELAAPARRREHHRRQHRHRAHRHAERPTRAERGRDERARVVEPRLRRSGSGRRLARLRCRRQPSGSRDRAGAVAPTRGSTPTGSIRRRRPTPSGHGTATMGVMVGGGAGGTTIGVAPGATLDRGADLRRRRPLHGECHPPGLQWVLDPDGNPATADAPTVVNNSWGFGDPGLQPRVPARRPGPASRRHHPGVLGRQRRTRHGDQREPRQLPGVVVGRRDDERRHHLLLQQPWPVVVW